jgi:hypothetical protein
LRRKTTLSQVMVLSRQKLPPYVVLFVFSKPLYIVVKNGKNSKFAFVDDRNVFSVSYIVFKISVGYKSVFYQKRQMTL